MISFRKYLPVSSQIFLLTTYRRKFASGIFFFKLQTKRFVFAVSSDAARRKNTRRNYCRDGIATLHNRKRAESADKSRAPRRAKNI